MTGANGEAGTIPAVVTAGGRIAGEFAQAAGTTIKALVPVGGKPLIAFMLNALQHSPGVGPIVVVGPNEILPALSDYPRVRFVPEGETGPENVLRGLSEVRAEVGSGMALVCTSDLPFVQAGSIAALLDAAPQTADIVFPVISRADYQSAFPASPNVWTRLSGGEYTGGSVLIVRPDALEKNRALIERVFAARKSQWEMARLLGIGFALRFKMGKLTIAEAETRASVLTGCRCHALLNADARLSADIDDKADYLWVQTQAKERIK